MPMNRARMANAGGTQRLGFLLTSERSVTSQQIVINVMPTSGYRPVGSNACGDLADSTIHEVPRPKKKMKWKAATATCILRKQPIFGLSLISNDATMRIANWVFTSGCKTLQCTCHFRRRRILHPLRYDTSTLSYQRASAKGPSGPRPWTSLDILRPRARSGE